MGVSDGGDEGGNILGDGFGNGIDIGVLTAQQDSSNRRQ